MLVVKEITPEDVREQSVTQLYFGYAEAHLQLAGISKER